LTHVSCQAKPGHWYWLKPGANKFNNTHSTETALFQTSDGGAFRALCCYDSPGHEGVKGRFRGELGSFDGDTGDGKNWGSFAGTAQSKPLPDLSLPPLPPHVDPGGHGGAEGQLMNEFVTAILQDRTPWCNVADALNLTVAGVVASQSAKKDGELLKIPQYAMPT
jgi:predicted dehydrogenase